MALDLATLTDELSAVNLLLATIAEAPVSSLDVVGSVDVATAVQALNEVNFAVQSKGWHWNTEEAMTFTPDGNSNIVLPANTLFIKEAYWVQSSILANVGERARKLYDRTNHTFTFTQPIVLDLVVALEWMEMPVYARRYITVRAAKQFQARLQSNRVVDQVGDWEVSDAHLTLEEAEDRAAQNNQVSGNAQLIWRLHGRARRRP